jgi:hypothetical protein
MLKLVLDPLEIAGGKRPPPQALPASYALPQR